MRKITILPLILWGSLLLITGCATSRIPSGPEVYSTMQHEGQLILGVIKVQDSRESKQAGNIGLASIYVESDDLTNMVTNYLIDCLNHKLQFNVEKVSAYTTENMQELSAKYKTKGTILLTITSLQMRSFDAIIEPVETDIKAKLQVYNQEGQLVFEDFFKGHDAERIGLSIVDKATGELVEDATEALMHDITLSISLRNALSAL